MSAPTEPPESETHKSVIIVEDDESTRLLYAHTLEGDGYEVYPVDNIKLALEILEKKRIDVIITDLGLVGESGFDLLRGLEGNLSSIPVVVVTADDRVESVQSALRERAFDYLTKPIATADLVEATKRATTESLGLLAAQQREDAAFAAQREAASRSGQRAALLALLFNRAAEGIVVLDHEGRVVDASDSFLELLDMAPRLVIGQPVDNFFQAHPTEGMLSRKVGELLTGEGAEDQWNGSMVLSERTGPRHLCDVRIFRCQMPATDVPTEQAYAVALVHHDPRREALSLQLQQAERLATVGILAGSAAHEIKNDLGPLIGYLSLHYKSEDDDPMAALLHDSARRIREHVDQILAPLRPRIRSRGAVLLQKSVDEVLVALRRAGKVRRLELTIKASADNITVFGDKDEIYQIVMNLLTNALDALFDGGGGHRGAIEVSFHEDGDRVLLIVKDDGRGISQENVDRVFDPFYTTKGSLGTGLGLPVVRDIARSLGGEIMLSSVVDKGTTVTVALPKFRGTLESA